MVYYGILFDCGSRGVFLGPQKAWAQPTGLRHRTPIWIESLKSEEIREDLFAATCFKVKGFEATV